MIYRKTAEKKRQINHAGVLWKRAICNIMKEEESIKKKPIKKEI